MKIKKGDIIVYNEQLNNINNDRNNLYLVLEKVDSLGILVVSKLKFYSTKLCDSKNIFQFKDGNNIIGINISKTSQINYIKKQDKIALYDYSITNPTELVSLIYVERKKYISRNTYKKNHKPHTKSKKQRKKQLVGFSQKNLESSTYKKTKGVHDPTYKGKIKIIRG